MIKGNISVQTDNIFPIIKKFLYSDQEIFLRELVSNAVDATTKLQTLAKRGEAVGNMDNLRIEVIPNRKAKTLTIRDKGIGLTTDEAQRYLSEVAFSSAAEFLEKYEEGSIIGHFGLGFYSAFMVAQRVEVVSKSYKEGEKAVKWSCDGTPAYEIEEVEKAERGTDIILHMNDADLEFLDDNKLGGLLDKYCKFLPIEIQFGTTTEKEGKKDVKKPYIINDTNPLWKRSPVDLTDEDYMAFYEKIYTVSPPPLFWIHLNIDYPFNLTGILYFPKLANALETPKNKVQLYSNQVYVTDDVKEILPEFLTLLHGVIDSPDIPLNVSRSYLQSDREVKKITSYITKKVSDKLSELFRTDREAYETKWRDIGVFVKYGVLSDAKFAEKAMEDYCLVQNTEGVYFTLPEYRAHIKDLQTDKNGRLVGLYTNGAATNDVQITAAKAKGYDVLVMDTTIDNHFMQEVEYKQKDPAMAFLRVDSETIDTIIEKDDHLQSVLTEEQQGIIKGVFDAFVKIPRTSTTVVLKALSPDDQPVQITRNEFTRRMSEMRQFQAVDFGGMPENLSVVINTNHPLITDNLLKINNLDDKTNLAMYLYDLARVGQGMLSGADMTAFLKRSLTFVK